MHLLREDFDLLEARLKTIDQALFDLGEEFHEAVNQSSETWHDNAPFDAVRDKQSILAMERARLIEIRIGARVIDSPHRHTRIAMGHRVVLRGPSTLRIFVGGDWSGREQVGEYRVATAGSPIGQALLGRRVGDTIQLPKGSFVVHEIKGDFTPSD